VLAQTGGPTWLNPKPDWRAVLFSVGIAGAAAVLFGLAPALQAVRQRRQATFLRQCLIGAQVAASCVLLIIAGLLLRAVDHVAAADPGFAYRQVISIDPRLSSHGYSAAAAQAYLDSLVSRTRALPGVESVALASTPPLGRLRVVMRLDAGNGPVDVHVNRIDPHFFRTMAIPILSGRNVQHGDTRTAVISQSLALRIWPGQDPLGRQIDDHTVVGVSGSARTVALEDPDAVEAYYLAEPADLAAMVVLVKTTGPPEAVAPVLAATARAIDAKVFPELQLLKARFQGKVQEAEYSAMAVSLLGGSALLLACLGIVGLVAYAVSQRTKEIGIRMALGANPGHVLSAILWQFLRPVVAGLLAGVGGAALLSQILRRELYGISHLDPVAYLTVVALFVVAVVLAALLPARRALRVDPLRALRYE
jgi:predicted permease